MQSIYWNMFIQDMTAHTNPFTIEQKEIVFNSNAEINVFEPI